MEEDSAALLGTDHLQLLSTHGQQGGAAQSGQAAHRSAGPAGGSVESVRENRKQEGVLD